MPNDDSIMVTQTTARGSVFDVGALFEIAGHDVNRAVFRHVLYSRMGDPEVWKKVADSIGKAAELDDSYRDDLLEGVLEECCVNGARTHHEGMLDAETGEVAHEGLPENPSAFNLVRRYQILKPDRCDFLGAHLFDYSKFSTEDKFVVPLEYIVRFGITSASSVFKKYLRMDGDAKKAFEHELGVSKPLGAWQYLEKPISDCTSKFEPEDRMVSKQEALTMCGLNGEMFVKSGKMAVLGAWAVRQLVEEIGLLLWDIKWEFARDGDDLVFVDTIDTDSFRATMFLEVDGRRFVNHYNKQAMRDYYNIMHGDWIAAINEAKAKGATEGVAFTEILKAGQDSGDYPGTPGVADEFGAIQERKMSAIRDYMLGDLPAEQAKADLQAAGMEEIGFFQAAGKLEEFARLNAV
ncbi:MAG: hypothetical protein HKN23_18445 [Verrucomicrobiales bacterium]|nr:hypothetical protein [Verrucomicrobiales bacterium]